MRRDVEDRMLAYLPRFKEWLKGEECRAFVSERDERVRRFQSMLSNDSIERLGEYELKEILTGLWATQFWSDTEKWFKKFLELNGNDIDRIKSSLRGLLDDGIPLAKRYDEFKANVKGLGPASISEILAFYNPSRYGIWNDRVRRAAELLGLSDELYAGKLSIKGSEYEKIMDVLGDIRAALERNGNGNGITAASYLDVDLFMYFLSKYSIEEQSRESERQKDSGFDHDEIAEMIERIGSMLGFEPEREVQVTMGARVDVVWTARIGNLGSIRYVFEVQRRGSRDSLILNLQKAKRDPAVQKLVVVSDEENLNRIREEMQDFHELKRHMIFLDVDNIIRAHERLNEVRELLRDLYSTH